ncbi:MAG TPA: TetR family transcriptional regulator [Solirubrobacteraceae bacterium]|nr:TetR family transcriptional regulator [Solirubrobacteraceae bacterium]
MHEIQRARLLAAAVDVVEDVGYAGMTVGAIIERARVSRKTFYEVFSDREDCFEAVFDHISAHASAVATAAYATQTDWLASIHAALGALLCLMDEEPALARLWVVEALGARRPVLERRARAMSILAGVVDEGRSVISERAQPPELTAEATVGGIGHIIYARLLRGSPEPLIDLLGQLMYTIALPYLGAARAHAERRRPTRRAPPVRKADRTRKHGLEDLKIRLTYRTVRTLEAIFEQPGASNREIADTCGITDQGQVSKLLSRLEGLGFTENRGLGQERGLPNAWYLTEGGIKIVQATSLHERFAA